VDLKATEAADRGRCSVVARQVETPPDGDRVLGLARRPRRRLPYLDDLKVGLVAAIIGGHAVIGYTTGD
jgi:hypothetical protein